MRPNPIFKSANHSATPSRARVGVAATTLLLCGLCACGPNALVVRGDQAMSKGEYGAAIEAYDEAAQQSANDPVEGPVARTRLAAARRDAASAAVAQGDAAFEGGHLESAADHYRRARAYAPTDEAVITAQSRLLSLRTQIESDMAAHTKKVSELRAAGDAAELLAWRKVASAVRSLWRWRADYPAVDSLWERTRHGAASRFVAQARRLMANRDNAAALQLVEEALRTDAETTGAVELRDTLRAAGDADGLAAEGNAALDRGDLEVAVDAYGRALQQSPQHAVARAGYRRARTAWVAAHLDAAQSARKAKKRRAALLLLRQGAEVGTDDAALGKALDKEKARAESEASAHFEREAIRLERRKLYGAALIAWRTAASLGSTRKDLGQRVEAATRRVEASRVYKLALDAPRLPKDRRAALEGPLSEGLAQRVGMPILGDAGVVLATGKAARDADGHATLDVTRFDITRITRPEERHKKILDHVAFPANPGWAAAQARQSTALSRLNQATDAIRPMDEQANRVEAAVADLDRQLAEVRRQVDAEDSKYYAGKEGPCADGSTRCAESYGHKRWAPQLAFYQDKIRKMTEKLRELAPKLTAARAALGAAQQAFDEAERTARDTPDRLRQEVWKDFPYTVMVHELRVEIDASLTWRDRVSGPALAVETTRIEDSRIDFSTPEIVVREQLVEAKSASAHPDDATLHAQFVARTLDELTAKVWPQLAGHGKRFVLRVEKAKKQDEKVHWQVLALSAGAGLDDVLRARLEQQLLEATGYDWQRTAVDLARIPF